MKVLVIGHSMVHKRQQWFFEKLAKLTNHTFVVGPRFWHDMTIQDYEHQNYSIIGLSVTNAPDIFMYELIGLETIIKMARPDIIYCQAELRSRQAQKAMQIASEEKIPLVIFVWENIFPPKSLEEQAVAEACKKIVCGNSEARHLLPHEFQPKSIILPQVGIELDYFKPLPSVTQLYDVVFCGRPVFEKGIEIIKQGCNSLNCSLNIISNKPYEEIPKLLNEGRVFASLPVATKTWKEQSGSYSNLEAMACGLPVITTKCGAIPEYLSNAAAYCNEDDAEDFIRVLKKMIFKEDFRDKHRDAGLEMARWYSNENIAGKLKDELEACI